MRITISGAPGSGTTTLGRAIADIFGYKYVSAGEVFREYAKERNIDIAELGRMAESDQTIDLEIDSRQKQIGESSDNIVIEGRLAGWMVDNADLKVLLYASPECRAQRIADREGRDINEALTLTVEREECEAKRYMDYYEIDIEDHSPYDIVINSETFDADELRAVIEAAVRTMI